MFILFITGASGVGKTTLVNALQTQLPHGSTACFYFDSIGVPSEAEMIARYGSGSEWQKAMMYQWVNKLTTEYCDKTLVILEGQVNLDFIVEAFESIHFKQYEIILVHCDTVTRHQRLNEDRNQTELVNETMDNWANYLYKQAISRQVTIIDTTYRSIDEIVTWFEKNILASNAKAYIKTHKINEGEKYDLIASDFAKLRNSFATEKKYLDLFIQHLQPGSSILDVGCGSGYPIASYFIEQGFQVTGVDSSKKLLEIAKIKCPTMQLIYGDIRDVTINGKFDAIIEWWCLFHLPKEDHAKMFAKFSEWLKPGGVLEFTSGDSEYAGKHSDMLEQELSFFSLNPMDYEKYLKENGFKLLLCENDQDQHLVWIAQKIA